MIEAHEWDDLDLHLVWDKHAERLAQLTLQEVADGDCLLKTRCFKKVKSQTCNENNERYKTYVRMGGWRRVGWDRRVGRGGVRRVA